MAITNDVAAGTRWHHAGVQRIMIDLETYGKAERQKSRDTVKSNHAIADIAEMRLALPDAHIVTRCEPCSMPEWGDHIEEVLRQEPTSVMLPMVESADDVERLSEAASGRAELIVMIETAAALHDLERLMAAAPTSTFFVGLNDLHIQLGHDFMFEPLAGGDIDLVADAARRHDVEFGFGGLARVGLGLVDSAALVNEHVRLGSTLAILARSFFSSLADPEDVEVIRSEIKKLRDVENRARQRTREQQDDDTIAVRAQIRRVAAQLALSQA